MNKLETQYGQLAPHVEAVADTADFQDVWLGEAVGTSAYSAAYLEATRDLRDHLVDAIESAKSTDNTELLLETEGDLLALRFLTATVARNTEERLRQIADKNEGRLPVDFDGILPMREVTAKDITAAGEMFGPNSGREFVNGELINTIYHAITQEALRRQGSQDVQ